MIILKYSLYNILSLVAQEEKIEDSKLFQWICEIIRKQTDKKLVEQYYTLFSHIRFENLTIEEAERFISDCPHSVISGAVWRAVCKRLIKKTQPHNVEEHEQVVNFPYDPKQPFKL